MSANDSLQFFLRLINQKHGSLRETANSLLRALAGEDPTAKKNAASTMLQAANDLRAILANSDVPAWLSETIRQLTAFCGGSWSSFDLLSNFIGQKAALDSHSWVFQENAEVAFDFDSIFEHFKAESRLPELFDELVRLLEDIQESGAIDSVTMLRALGKVISTIKRCKDGSYFSLNSAWEFLLSFLNNYMWGELSKLPVLGTALDALGKTIRETNEEMFLLHTQVRDEMIRAVEEEVKVLADKSAFPFVAYDKSGHLLPSLLRQLPNAAA